jgi:hypothetical protein
MERRRQGGRGARSASAGLVLLVSGLCACTPRVIQHLEPPLLPSAPRRAVTEWPSSAPALFSLTALGHVEIQRGGEKVKLTSLLRERHIVVIMPCGAYNSQWSRTLTRLRLSYQHLNLGIDALVVETCAGHEGRNMPWKADPLTKHPLGRDHHGNVVVLDKLGVVLDQSLAHTPDGLITALGFLKDSWPPLRRSVRAGQVQQVRRDRSRASLLFRRARTARARGQRHAALGLLARTIVFDTRHEGARRLLAVISAELGELVRAADQVHWWTQRFGALSAGRLRARVETAWRWRQARQREHNGGEAGQRP